MMRTVSNLSDVYKSTYEIKMKFGFADGDTRSISLDNPKNNLQASQIHELSNFVKNNNLLIGDKFGADSAGILYADIIESTKITLDI